MLTSSGGLHYTCLFINEVFETVFGGIEKSEYNLGQHFYKLHLNVMG